MKAMLSMKQATVKCLIVLVTLSQIKQSGQNPGYHDFWSLNCNLNTISITGYKIGSGHFPPEVFGFGINIIHALLATGEI